MSVQNKFHWQFLFLLEVISIWQWDYVCLHTFRNLERLINFTTMYLWLQLSCFHEFMNSWIHDLSRYMKIRWWNMKVPFVLQLSRYMKIRWNVNVNHHQLLTNTQRSKVYWLVKTVSLLHVLQIKFSRQVLTWNPRSIKIKYYILYWKLRTSSNL